MPTFDFDAIVIGGGSAGLTAAGLAANLGAKTLLVEKEQLGGDCTWTGCVPSKILLKAGKVAHQIRSAGKYGLIDGSPQIDYSKLMNHLKQRQEEIYEEADRPAIYENMGIEVEHGEARFLDEHRIEIALASGEHRELSARYFFICTGARPALPPIGGIGEVDYLTSESLFEAYKLPDELHIIGAGNIGTEMAQAMNRLGAKVTVLDMADRIMTRDDAELSGMLRNILAEEGINYKLGASVERIQKDDGRMLISIETGGRHETITGNQLLVATGRRANVEDLELEAAGIDYSSNGITVNDRCRTSRKHIYACGDVTGRYQFTHMSDHMAKVAVTNALVKLPVKIDADHVPWVTFTDPELGHVGATGKHLEEAGTNFETYRFPYSKLDRALTDSETEGLIKVYARKWDGKIFGASVLGARAGELISEYAVAMKNGISLRNIADTIHPYPAYNLGVRRAADQWYIKKQSEWQVKLLKKIFGYRGEVPDFSDPDRIV
ncbi:MAG TPA: FAD-dependent oxidoreductase [Fodinibius sp.]|nr:FAD-dependent oxidoreductase [Fodinibius sp.]